MCNFVIHAVLMQNGKSMVFYYTPPRTPPTPPRHSNVWSFSKRNISPNFSFGNRSRDFPSLHFRDPPLAPHPRNVTQQFTNILQINLIYKYFTAKRAPGVLCLGTLTSPMENPPNQPTFEESTDFFMGSFVTFWGGRVPKVFSRKDIKSTNALCGYPPK